MKRYDEALADYTRAIELDPSDAEFFGSRGQAYQAIGRYDEALADFNRAIELDPNYRPQQGGLGSESG
jgi:tetratricopeptide (TPR) repeat protein